MGQFPPHESGNTGMPDDPPRRARGPSPDRTARTRQAIIEAALDVFLAEGFADARMADVAARAGVAKGTLYLHFTDKAALFEGMLRAVLEVPLAGLADAAPAAGETVRGFLGRALRPVLRDMEGSRRAALVRLVIAEGARFPEIAALYRRIVIDPALAAIRTLAARAQAAGELRGEALLHHPHLLAAPIVIATLWNGLFALGDPVEAETLFEAQLDLLFGPAMPVPASSRTR